MLAKELIFATLVVVLVVGFHITALALLWRLLRSHTIIVRDLRIVPLTMLISATIGIIAIHTIEIWFYAGLYMEIRAFTTFEQALYFSTVTYASIGYGDMLLPVEWRIFGAIEGPVGVVMLGLSTAFIVAVMMRLKLVSQDWFTGVHHEDHPDER